MAGSQADAVAAGQTSERPALVCQQLKAALSGLFDASLAQRAASCRQLLTLFGSSETPTDEQISLEKELSKALLIQVLSPELRRVALAALQQLPRWDPEVLNRAVRIPPFQREDDQNATKRPMEPWYGALFFVLDDEDQYIRAAALKVLVKALCCKSGDGKVPEVEGLFQRLAQIASLCLHDHAELVRNEAAAALVEVMTTPPPLSVFCVSATVPSLSTPLAAHRCRPGHPPGQEPARPDQLGQVTRSPKPCSSQ